MLTRALLFMALIGATYAACDRHASAATTECELAVARAERDAYVATRTQHACMDPDECRVADELVRAATAQLEAVRAMCAPVTSQADPFEASEPAPLMAGVPEYAGDDAAFRAVMGE